MRFLSWMIFRFQLLIFRGVKLVVLKWMVHFRTEKNICIIHEPNPQSCYMSCWGFRYVARVIQKSWYFVHTTVDGWNPAPVDMVNLPLFSGFYTSQVVQDFFHQQYHYIYTYSCRNYPAFLNSQPSVCSSVGSKKNDGVLWLGLGGLDVFMIFWRSTIRTERYMGK